MKKLVRCKACGYILEEGKLGEKCPACGAPKTAFAPFVDPISASRRRLLKLDLHPTAVHFPISFIVAVLVFSISILFLSGEARTWLLDAIKILALLIPVLVIIAGSVGFIDGRIRFRKIGNSLILQRKIIYATTLFIVSTSLAIIIWVLGQTTTITAIIVILLAAICLGIVIILALLGTSINEAAFPGS